jgi:hypothetical protein
MNDPRSVEPVECDPVAGRDTEFVEWKGGRPPRLAV